MPFVILALGVLLLLFLMVRMKINGFISLLLVAFLVALAQGMPMEDIADSIVAGVGGQVDDLLLILGLGAMLGNIMADYGAAHRLAMTLIGKFGLKYAQVAIVIVAFLIGVVLFWETAWVILIPIVFAIVRETRVKLLWLAVPLAIALSSMHSFLPPHPGPTAVADIFGASIGKTLVYGLIIAIPIGASVALLWPRIPFIRRLDPQIPAGLVEEHSFDERDMPSFGMSLVITLLPVVLIGGASIVEMALGKDAAGMTVVRFIGEAPVSLLIAVLFAVAYFTLRRGIGMDSLMKSAANAAKAIAMILMVIGAGGAFKQVLVDGGISAYVGDVTGQWPLSPIFLGWAVAVIMRISLGSASVAVVAAAGIALPLVTAGGVSPELMTLAVASGSVACSHVNDPGFWMFKEFLGLSVMETVKVRTTYTSVLSILGLLGVLGLNAVLG